MALLASRGIVEPSDDALLGALMESEFQTHVIHLARGWFKAHTATKK